MGETIESKLSAVGSDAGRDRPSRCRNVARLFSAVPFTVDSLPGEPVITARQPIRILGRQADASPFVRNPKLLVHANGQSDRQTNFSVMASGSSACAGFEQMTGDLMDLCVPRCSIAGVYQLVPRWVCRRSKISCNSGPAPVTPDTPIIGWPSKLPTQTPMVNSGV